MNQSSSKNNHSTSEVLNGVKTAFGMLLFPVILYGLFTLITYLSTGSIFLSGQVTLETYLRNVAYMGLLGLAVSLQVPNGRFDFSIGSILVVSIIVAGNIAAMFNLSSFVTLVLAMLVGCVLGAISGLIYVTLKIKAMVTSIGVMMMYEALSSFFFNGGGLNAEAFTAPMFSLVKNVWGMLVVFVVLTAFVYVLKKYTKFGYNLRSIKGGQKIAVDAGVNEKANAITCYAIAGALAGASSLIYAFKNSGVVSAQSGMSTIGIMFGGFLAMMIGEFMERFDEISFGIFVGAIAAAMYHQFLYAIGCDVDAVTLINAFTLLGILIFNKYFESIRRSVTKAFKNRGKKAAIA